MELVWNPLTLLVVYITLGCMAGILRNGQTSDVKLSNISRLGELQNLSRPDHPIASLPTKDDMIRCGFGWTCSNGDCLDNKFVCDGKLDCKDGSDEGQECGTPCSHKICLDACHKSPRGPRCICPSGYRQAGDSLSCEDVDECMLQPPVCEHYCVNTNGSHLCRDYPKGATTTGHEGHGGLPLAAWCCSPTLLSLTLIAVALLFLQRWWQARKMGRNLSPEEIKEFLEGNEAAAKKLDVGAEQAMLLPFKLRLEPDDIVVDPARDSVLGSGNFGVVYRGFYKCETIAMKTFKRAVEMEEFRAVLVETKIMAYIGEHEHVVKFIGADVSKISDRKLILVTELSPCGDLLHYLRKIDPSYWQPQKGGCTPEGVSPHTLSAWCTQIAAGMEHLEAKKIVHGDLAARNILVFKDGLVKITDFGLSKQLYANSEYFIKRQRMLPWKWAALELLTQREFSTDSDIWAFGVTAWEIFSLGREPYEELDIGLSFIKHLEQGNRLRQPKYATHGIYEMLLECWNINRQSRPRFAILREFFGEEAKQFRAVISDITEDSVHGYYNV